VIISGVSWSYLLDGSSDASGRCQYCSNSFNKINIRQWEKRSFCVSTDNSTEIIYCGHVLSGCAGRRTTSGRACALCYFRWVRSARQRVGPSARLIIKCRAWSVHCIGSQTAHTVCWHDVLESGRKTFKQCWLPCSKCTHFVASEKLSFEHYETVAVTNARDFLKTFYQGIIATYYRWDGQLCTYNPLVWFIFRIQYTKNY